MFFYISLPIQNTHGPSKCVSQDIWCDSTFLIISSACHVIPLSWRAFPWNEAKVRHTSTPHLDLHPTTTCWTCPPKAHSQCTPFLWSSILPPNFIQSSFELTIKLRLIISLFWWEKRMEEVKKANQKSEQSSLILNCSSELNLKKHKISPFNLPFSLFGKRTLFPANPNQKEGVRDFSQRIRVVFFTAFELAFTVTFSSTEIIQHTICLYLMTWNLFYMINTWFSLGNMQLD